MIDGMNVTSAKISRQVVDFPRIQKAIRSKV